MQHAQSFKGGSQHAHVLSGRPMPMPMRPMRRWEELPVGLVESILRQDPFRPVVGAPRRRSRRTMPEGPASRQPRSKGVRFFALPVEQPRRFKTQWKHRSHCAVSVSLPFTCSGRSVPHRGSRMTCPLPPRRRRMGSRWRHVAIQSERVGVSPRSVRNHPSESDKKVDCKFKT